MPDTAFFSPELFDFLRQLKRHNNREWFAKKRSSDMGILCICRCFFGPHFAWNETLWSKSCYKRIA